MGEDVLNLSPFKRFKLWLGFPVYVGDRTRDDWRGPLPFYAFKCPVHGVQVDYPHGYRDRLNCPECRDNFLSQTPYPAEDQTSLSQFCGEISHSKPRDATLQRGASLVPEGDENQK